MNKVRIRPFRPEDQAAAQRLIVTGLAEHFGFLDPTANPDLDDIASTYADGTFLLAWMGDELVGTGALIYEEKGVGRIVRMSVAPHLRRRGIGMLILEHLREQARAAGYHQIVLETTATWDDVIAFYRRNGFRTIGSWDGDTHFVLDLVRGKEMGDWADWQENYIHGTLIIWPPDPVRWKVNRLRQEYDPVSQAICEAHITLTQPFLRQPGAPEWTTLHQIVAGFDPFEITYGPLNSFLPYPCIWFEIHPSRTVLRIRHALHQTGLFNLDLPHTDDFVPHMTITESLSGIEAAQGLFEQLSRGVLGGSFTCTSMAYIVPDASFQFHVERELPLKGEQKTA